VNESLDEWIVREYEHAAKMMLRSVSPDLVKTRPGFGQTIVPRRGAIVASPVLAAYDPDPDYFFHWYRDSAVVIEALRLLREDGRAPAADGHFADFVEFNLALERLDGRELVQHAEWRTRVRTDFVQFLRTDADLAAVTGAAVAAETRVNADATLDISSWARPQHDGPALRALAVLRWMQGISLEAGLASAASRLVRADLAFTRARWRVPCFDIWEEEQGLHYYTLCVAAAALEQGALWLARFGELAESREYAHESTLIRRTLDEYWLPEQGFFKSRVLASGARSAKELDIAVILAAIHAAGCGETHNARDPRVHATLARLEALFEAEYPINRERPSNQAPALGRYSGDVYYSGGAYYFSTLGAAELCFLGAVGAADAAERVRRGDAFLEMVRAHTPASGDLSEQFDQKTGAQTSAKHLAWSYAAFISCVAARRVAIARPGSG
jgi:glucoamylase